MWTKLDDSFMLHAKVMKARTLGGEGAVTLIVGGFCYVGQKLTDGHIPRTSLPMLAPDLGRVGPSPGLTAEQLAPILVACGLWEVDPGGDGWWVHDYLDYNPPAEEVLEKRAKDAERQGKSRSRKRRNAVTPPVSHAVTPPVTPGVTSWVASPPDEAKPVRHSVSHTVTPPVSPRGPVPVPVPVPAEKQDNSACNGEAVPGPVAYNLEGGEFKSLDSWAKASRARYKRLEQDEAAGPSFDPMNLEAGVARVRAADPQLTPEAAKEIWIQLRRAERESA